MSFSSSFLIVLSCVMAHCISFFPSTKHSTVVAATTSAVRRLPTHRFPARRAASVAWNGSIGVSSRSPCATPPASVVFLMEMFRETTGEATAGPPSPRPPLRCSSSDATLISPTNSPASRVATFTGSPESVSHTTMSTFPFLIRNTSSVARWPCLIRNSPFLYVFVGSFMPLAKSRSLFLIRRGAGRTLETCRIQGWSSASFALSRFAGLYCKHPRTKSRAFPETVSHS
mmetsp:Transcript_13721/g.51324  ORF Transcript_13721/g.51324 Transcript_13721/m.51324 type:complete len:229 (-) Transcript_13721:975-1661(-)